MGNPKPYLQTACVCEKILIEPDQVPSIIRIVGKFIVTPQTIQPADIPIGFPVSLFISLKGGEFKGKGKVNIFSTRPDGSEGPKSQNEVEFTTPLTTAQIKAEFHVISPQNGIYWFSVLWNEELLTKIPLEVEVTKPSQPRTVSASVPQQKPN